MEHLYLTKAEVKALNARRQGRECRRVCHIPEKGLYFGLRGQVYSCCFNKAYVLGTYPEQSIREIWKGQALKAQRKAIKRWDMSLGCQGCHSLIQSGNFNALPLRNYDRFAARSWGWPAKMDFELFNTCNLECIMCRGEFSSTIRKNREGLPPIESPYDAAFFDQVEEFIPHLKSSHFLGGEPFLIPQYIDLWERMAAINPALAVSVQTNCTVLNQRTKDLLERMNFHISVSIDSVSAENYPKIRVNGNWDRVLENLRHFRDYTRRRGTLLTMAFCPMPQNWRELPDAVHFCNEWEMPLMFTTVEAPPHCSLSALSYHELQEIEAGLFQHSLPSSTPLQLQNRQSYLDLAAQISAWKEAAKLRELAGIQSQPRDFAEFIEQVSRMAYLNGNGDRIATEGLVRDIQSKLQFVLDQSEQRGLRAEAEAKMIQTQPELVIRSVPGLSPQELLRLFGNYVMPLE
ncbi:MAG: radical SAM protein [Bacteroidia bacterium]